MLATLLRVRDYMRQAFDKLPFWVTDPNSPLYDLTKDIKIPVIDVTPGELVPFILSLDDAIDTVQRVVTDPQNDLQRLIGIVFDKLGLEIETDTDTFRIWMQGNVLRARLFLITPELDRDFDFNFDLQAFKDIAGQIDLAGLDGIEELLQVEGSGSVNVKAFASARLEGGVDLGPRKQGQPVDKFLFDWNETLQEGTRVDAGFKVLGQNMNLGFEIFDFVGLETINGAQFDLDGNGVLDDVTYDAAITMDADNDTTTNPELTTPGDRSDFVTLTFVLDQSPNTGVPDDGLFRFDENLIGDNVQFEGVDGGFTLLLPLQINASTIPVPLTGLDQSPLRIATNPFYVTTDAVTNDIVRNQGFEEIFRHIADDPSKGAEPPIIFEAPDVVGALEDLIDLPGLAFTLLDRLADEIIDLRTDLVVESNGNGSILTETISGLNASLNDILGIDRFLNIGAYVKHYLRPSLSNNGFVRDPNIPLGGPDYYENGDP